MKAKNISNDSIFMIVLIVLQSLTCIWAKDNLISFISALSGIISVVLCSQKKISFYVFGFIQVITYIILAVHEHLWGEFAENIFYFVTMVFGVAVWKKNYNDEKNEVNVKELTKKAKAIFLAAFGILTAITFGILAAFTNDSHPFLDSISTVPAFIAQYLMIKGYKEQWTYWLIVDFTTLALWISIGNPIMIVQYVLWIANCIYGIKKWNE